MDPLAGGLAGLECASARLVARSKYIYINFLSAGELPAIARLASLTLALAAAGTQLPVSSQAGYRVVRGAEALTAGAAFWVCISWSSRSRWAQCGQAGRAQSGWVRVSVHSAGGSWCRAAPGAERLLVQSGSWYRYRAKNRGASVLSDAGLAGPATRATPRPCHLGGSWPALGSWSDRDAAKRSAAT